MPSIQPLAREDLPEFQHLFERRDVSHGFVPNSFLTMGRIPGLLQGFVSIVDSVYYEGKLDLTLKRMVSLMRSTASGCRYCQAHTSTHALEAGVDADKLAAMWDFESDDRFTEAERAALRLARDAAQVPSPVTEEHYALLREHFDDDELTELVGVICAFAFINSWNDTVGTMLEEIPLQRASATFEAQGWHPGKHAPEE